VKPLVLALRFLSELALLGVLGWWGFATGDSLPAQIALGLGAPLAAILVWGRFVAPRSANRLEDPARIAVEVVLFTLGAAALWDLRDWGVALGFLGLSIGLAQLTRQVGEDLAAA
jgi:hypothetical protein